MLWLEDMLRVIGDWGWIIEVAFIVECGNYKLWLENLMDSSDIVDAAWRWL